jgi:pimeloyl-ACP methyl ester carboxylesterase
MRDETLSANGLTFHALTDGHPGAPLILFLHGFPEFADAWAHVLPAFADQWYAVAPDQRGYARSAKPENLDAYRIKYLVRDVLTLAEQLSPGRPFALVGHDWGASVAYATAIAAPRRVSRLAVINGVHPGPFQKALLEDEAQRRASTYMHELCDPTAETRLSANGFAALFDLLGRFGAVDWLTEHKRAAYLAAWSQPGALTGMLNWYRASPLLVPRPREAVDAANAPQLDPAQLRIRMPHLVIWGMQDGALLPVSRATLDAYCDDLTVYEFARADHWVVHHLPGDVIARLRDFLG